MPALTLLVCDRDGNRLGELPSAAAGGAIVDRLNTPAQLNIGVGIDEFGELTVDGREIQAWVAGETAPRAIYVPWIDSKPPGARRTTIACGSLESLLARRYVNDEGGDLLFDGVDQHNIGWGLVDYTQDLLSGDLNISASTFGLSGVTRDRTFLAAQRPSILEALTAMTRLIDGFDWSIVPVAADRREWTPYFPARGTLHNEWALGYGRSTRGNIVDYGWTRDRSSRATVAYGAGAGEGAGRLVGSYTHPDVTGGTVDRLEASFVVSSSIVDAATIDDQAEELVAHRADPVVTLNEVTVRDDPATGTLVGQIAPGDTVPVRIVDGTIDIDTTMRVMQVAYRPVEDLVTLELGPT